MLALESGNPPWAEERVVSAELVFVCCIVVEDILEVVGMFGSVAEVISVVQERSGRTSSESKHIPSVRLSPFNTMNQEGLVIAYLPLWGSL